MLDACDTNKDGIVTKDEYLKMSAMLWDKKHASMMKSDKTMQTGVMNKAQFRQFASSLFQDPGLIGGN